MDCRRCATCCTAPDISTLAKPVGVPCQYLDTEGKCRIYSKRPAVCRNYLPDEICEIIDAPTLEQRVTNYLRIFSLRNE
ncbi:MAG: YkgJ family cysteine cluster protein [Deltaproteobacteria bacterium]|nr:YkgJ family cysteine cluster protein [Deltaproteobacteria bacterium]TLN02554.1 MAG: YkgJ family cysteine cluster protein [bacterium]